MLLLDEPLAALDAKLREEMQLELITLQKEVGITFVYVTHDQQEALALSHRIAVMNKGRVEQLDEPSKIYGFPQNRFVADFIGTCNILDGRGAASDGGRLRARRRRARAKSTRCRASTVAPGGEGRARAAARAGRASARSWRRRRTRTTFAGKVFDFLYLGDVTVYVVELRPTAAGRGDAAQLRARPRQVLRGRRRGGDRAGASTPAASSTD